MAQPKLWRRLGRGRTATFEAPPPPTAGFAWAELMFAIALFAFGVWGIVGTMAFVQKSNTLGAGRLAGFGISLPILVAIVGLAMAVDAGLRIRRTLSAKLSWARFMGDEAERNRLIDAVVLEMQTDTTQKPAVQLSPGARRVRARGLFKRHGVAGATLLDFLANQAAERLV